MAAPREPNTPPLPGSPSGDKENKDGGMSWAGQLWKQYDPINKIIFPGVGSKPTYNERGTELRNEAPARDVRPVRSPRVERVASSRPETTDSTNTAFDFFRCFSQTQNAFANDHTRVQDTRFFRDATRRARLFSRVTLAVP